MKIVQFKDGRYGVRRWRFGYEFLDLRDGSYWWVAKHNANEYSKTEDIKQAVKIFDMVSDNGKPIKAVENGGRND